MQHSMSSSVRCQASELEPRLTFHHTSLPVLTRHVLSIVLADKAHVLRLQRVNALIFMSGGAFFVGGSLLFFPSMEHLIMHGGWLYITGCTLTLIAALLGALTAAEMRKVT
jgi:hypothetical protein